MKSRLFHTLLTTAALIASVAVQAQETYRFRPIDNAPTLLDQMLQVGETSRHVVISSTRKVVSEKSDPDVDWEQTLDISVDHLMLQFTFRDSKAYYSVPITVWDYKPNPGGTVPQKLYEGTLANLEEETMVYPLPSDLRQRLRFIDHIATTERPWYGGGSSATDNTFWFSVDGVPLLLGYAAGAALSGVMDESPHTGAMGTFMNPKFVVLPGAEVQFQASLAKAGIYSKLNVTERFRELEKTIFGEQLETAELDYARDNEVAFEGDFGGTVRVATYKPGSNRDSAVTLTHQRIGVQFVSAYLSRSSNLKVRVIEFDRPTRTQKVKEMGLDEWMQTIAAYTPKEGPAWAAHFGNVALVRVSKPDAERIKRLYVDYADHYIYFTMDGRPVLFQYVFASYADDKGLGRSMVSSYYRTPQRLILPGLDFPIADYRVLAPIESATVSPRDVFEQLKAANQGAKK